jgi:hypothetical protein
MNRHIALRLVTIAGAAILAMAVTIPASDAVAQQKQQVSFKAPAENSKYTQQLNVDAGDMPDHIVRIYETHRTYPNNAPVINGLKLVEEWDRGTADFVAGNGGGPQYIVYLMENGDKVFARTTNVVQTNAGKLTATGAGYITGGTGKVAAIHGIVRTSTNFDPKSGFNEGQTDIEYSIGK